MIDPTFHTAACITIEKTIALALRYDPASRIALTRLQGKVLAIELAQPALTFYFIPTKNGLGVQSYCEAPITTRLKGSPLALATLANSSRLNLSDANVEVFGSTGLLIELQAIAKNLDVDWEQAISEVLGDILGHETAKAIRTLFGWSKQRQKIFKRLLGEYLSEELQTVPSSTELKFYFNEVDGLRLATDRIAEKIGNLKTRIQEAAHSSDR